MNKIPHKPKVNIVSLLFTFSLAILLFGTGLKFGEYKTRLELFQSPAFSTTKSRLNPNQQKKIKNIDFSLFWIAWDKLGEKFVDKTHLDPQKMYYGAIKGMVASLDDPYTFFLTPEENKETKDDLGGKFEGIGAQLGLKENRIVVIAPLKNSPAEKAGVLAGDHIIKVDGAITETWTLPYAVSKIRGPQGTKVKLTILRGDKEIETEITREEIQVDSVEITYQNNIAVLKLNKFGDETTAEWKKAVNTISKKYKAHEIKAMILDLRDNPGGYLEGSVFIASEFLPEGKIIVKQEFNNKNSQKYEVNHAGKLLEIPLIVLINKGSASASEIVAGALRDHRRAQLVGEQSFGKGSIQEAIDLKDGAGIHITIAKWILPNGNWINHTGVAPDVKIENKIEEGNALDEQPDLQLEKAIEMLLQ